MNVHAPSMIYALHGAVGSSKDWNLFQEKLPDLNVVNLWRFLACCPKPLPELAEAINNEIQEPPHTLLGYSMGGRIALHCLLQNPTHWKKAVIVSAHPGLTSKAQRAERRSHDAEWAAKCLRLPFEEFLEVWNQQGILPESLLPERLHLKMWKKQIARSFIDWSTGAQEDLLPALSSLSTEVLWITGERDQKFFQLAKNTCQQMPNATHLTIPNCGHRVPWEQPEEFSRIVSEFTQT